MRRAATALVSRLRGFDSAGEATSGEEAVERVEADGPDLVLMDINLPGISGIEATRRIAAEHEPCKPMVVLVSTYPMEDLPADALTCGACGYVRKEDLSLAVLRHLWEAGGDPAFHHPQHS